MSPMIFSESKMPKHDVRDGLADILQREGVADAEIARKEAERGRKRKVDGLNYLNGSRKRSRSDSSCSSYSVSTISTVLSHSPSPDRAGHTHTGQSQMLSNLGIDRKRRRSCNASMSYSSDSSRDNRRSSRRDQVRNNRRDDMGERKRMHSRHRSASNDSDASIGESCRKFSLDTDRSKRRRHSSRSPIDRGRDRDVCSKRGGRRTHSPAESRDRGEVVRNRKSMTPNLSRPDDIFRRQHNPRTDHSKIYSRGYDRYGGSARDQDGIKNDHQQVETRPPRSERSLSPFSKRLALTQAMNMGH